MRATGRLYRQALAAEAEMFGENYHAQFGGAKREAWWSRELEGYWPVIEAVARLLIDGEVVDHDTVDGLLEEHWTRDVPEQPSESLLARPIGGVL
jgi:hypothetical protein